MVFSIQSFLYLQWTSDKDLMSMAQKLGVKDVTEIRFAENKINGQSRGWLAFERSFTLFLSKTTCYNLVWYLYCICFFNLHALMLPLCCSYAELVVETEESLKKMLERIPKCKINGERIDCRFATRQNLVMFEDVANKRKSTTKLRE